MALVEVVETADYSYQMAHMIAVAAEITRAAARIISICVTSLCWLAREGFLFACVHSSIVSVWVKLLF